jgi:dGTPase
MRTREEIEKLESETLAPYAAKSRESAGREFSEPTHPARTCYQRDRDRIVHCEAFRKLEYKTQVFSIFEGDYYRTRLTHTLEVAQLARTIGRNLRLNEDLIEAIALAHDLGHPPFGHAGEQALNKIMEKQGGFNHNKRSFEIVTKYEKRYPDFDGLNLSREVLVGILKHETQYDMAGISEKYPEGPSLEARVVDCADSLAYLNHDVDDGLESKCITIEDLKESGLWQRAIRNLADTIRHDNSEMLRYQIVRQLIDMQVRDLLATTDQKLSALHLASAAEARQKAREVVSFSPQMKQDRDALQQLLYDKLYSHHRVMRMTSRAKRIIRELFAAYLREPNQLPPWVYPAGEFSLERKYEIICNYIASMTDRSASDERKKLTD